MNPIAIAQYPDDFINAVNLLAQRRDGEMMTLKEQLDGGKLIFSDHAIQSSKLVGGLTSVILIDPTANDDRDLALRNIDKARLNKDEYFMITSIQLEAATNTGLTLAQLKTIQWGSTKDSGNAPDDGILQNGEINFRTRSMSILRNCPLSKFVEGNLQVRVGELPLSTRRIIRPNDEIFLEVRFGAAAPAAYALRATIHGLITVPNNG